MRIVGGEHRGRHLKAPRGGGVRPTSDRVREAIFNMLGPLDGASVLDLFAGTGAIGIEAISRGAGRVVFVDSAASAVRLVRANLSLLGDAAADTTVEHLDAATAVRRLAERGERFDVVFLDPPYAVAGDILPRLLPSLGRLFRAGTTLLVECHRSQQQDVAAILEALEGVVVERSRRYGDSAIVIATAEELPAKHRDTETRPWQ